MAERVIQQADLRTIENNLGAIHEDLRTIDSSVGTVNDNVKVVYDEIGALAKEFHDFVNLQQRANRLGQAETRLVKIRQELDKKFGHYDIVRRTTTGILQADDLGIVKKDTISTATEELMIETPNYWLAPCLVALAAWINDQPELAEKAVREGIRRNDEKTSLFFDLPPRGPEKSLPEVDAALSRQSGRRKSGPEDHHHLGRIRQRPAGRGFGGRHLPPDERLAGSPDGKTGVRRAADPAVVGRHQHKAPADR